MSRARYIGNSLRGGAILLAALVVGTLTSGCASKEPETPGGPPVMRRLTEAQYRNTIRDVFGPGINTVARFDPISREEGLIAVGAAAASITPSAYERYAALAQLIAGQVVSPANRDYLLPCAPATQTAADEACAREAIGKIGRLLYRRKLTVNEEARLVQVANEGAASLDDFYQGLGYSIAAMLQSPMFMFISDTVEVDPARPGTQRLTAYAKASRLSFLLWNSTPDDALLAAAESGALHDKKEYEAQVDRMLLSHRVEDSVRAFFTDMLALDGFDTLSKDSVIYPAFVMATMEDSREQVLRLVVSELLEKKAGYPSLFTTRHTFMSGPLGMVYQLPVGNPNGWVPYEFSEADKRRGLLGHVGFLALHAHAGKSSPTIRGRAVRELLMCQRVPDPPSNVDFSDFNSASASPMNTARERLHIHNSEPSCAGCHALVDPIGLTLESFDGAGQWRTMEGGQLIDTSGELDGVEYADSTGLAEAVANNPAVTACLVRRLYAYSTGRAPARSDLAALEYLRTRFEDDGFRFPDLLRTLATSNAFIAVKAATSSANDESELTAVLTANP